MTNRRVLLVSSEPLWTEGIERVLSRVEGVEVSGPVEPGDDVFRQLQSDVPDLVIIVDRDEGRELEDSLTSRILAEHPGLPVIRMSDELRLYVSRVLPTSINTLVQFIREMAPASSPERPSSPSNDLDLGAHNTDPTIGL